MAVKVYLKKGNQNYKEKRYIRELNKVIEQKLSEDPLFKFEPATNFKELEDLHNTYCVTDVEFTEVPEKGGKTTETEETQTHEEFRKGMKETVEPVDDTDDGGELNSDEVTDVFNREEPIVRDYVLDEGMQKGGEASDADSHRGQTEFEEPKDYKDSFDLPNNETNPNANKGSNQQSNNQQQSQPRNNRVENPVNPKYNDMSSQKQKRSNKRFAKYIVETVCMLTEKGFVWFANKDINEAKLAEYVVNGTIDNEQLDLMITLTDGQDATIRQFFQQQCIAAEELSRIDKEEKDDLIDALAEVLSEKGVAPTPTQELIMISLKVFGQQAVMLLTLKSQTNSLLSQLKSMKAGNEQPEQQEQQKQRTPPVTHTHVHKEQTVTTTTDTDTETKDEGQSNVPVYVDEFAEKHGIGDNIETKE